MGLPRSFVDYIRNVNTVDRYPTSSGNQDPKSTAATTSKAGDVKTNDVTDNKTNNNEDPIMISSPNPTVANP